MGHVRVRYRYRLREEGELDDIGTMIFFYSPKCLGFHVQDLLWREMRNRCQQACYWGHVHCGVCCDNLGKQNILNGSNEAL